MIMILKKMVLGMLIAGMAVSALSGCSLINKVEEESEPVSQTALPRPDNDTVNIDDTQIEGSDIVDGVSFKILSEPKTMYVKDTVYIFESPSFSSGVAKKAGKGDMVIETAVSRDWAEITFETGKMGYIATSNLAETYEDAMKVYDEDVIPTRDPNRPNDDDGMVIIDSSIGIHDEEETTDLFETSTEPVTEEQDERVSNITYPSNPVTETEEYGMKFAATDITATVIQGTANIYREPNAESVMVASFTQDGQVNCIGIGAGGWCKVKLPNDDIGYIESSHLMQ